MYIPYSLYLYEPVAKFFEFFESYFEFLYEIFVYLILKGVICALCTTFVGE